MGEVNSWRGTRMRRDDGLLGVVVDDSNGLVFRYLDIRWSDGAVTQLTLNNSDRSPEDPLGVHWEYNPGRWAYLSDSRDGQQPEVPLEVNDPAHPLLRSKP